MLFIHNSQVPYLGFSVLFQRFPRYQNKRLDILCRAIRRVGKYRLAMFP